MTAMLDEPAESPYAATAELYWKAGWTGVLPLPARKKKSPPSGYTGHGAPYLSYPDVHSLIEVEGAHGANVCLRMPDTVIGIDVDCYGNKPGAASLAALTAKCGPLPATWTSTSRGQGDPSRISLYRVPAGSAFKGDAAPAVEIIQAGHRYAVVWPSIHPEGRVYRWFTPQGVVSVQFPTPEELPELPAAWRTELASTTPRAATVELNYGEVNGWLNTTRPGPLCQIVANTVNKYAARLRDPQSGARHDIALAGSRTLVAFGGEGHAGAKDAVRQLMDAFLDAAADPARGGHRDDAEARKEFASMVAGAVRIAAAANPTPGTSCDCMTNDDLRTLAGLGQTAQPQPRADPGGQPDPPPAGKQGGDLRFYGATEDGLARALHDHFGDRLRYCVDGRKMWLAWDGARWAFDHAEVHREAVKKLGRALPDTDDWKGFRKQVLGARGTSGVARQAQSTPEMVVRAQQLDADPWALNTPAGIVDLRTGTLRPHNPDEMHTRTTGVSPDHTAERSRWVTFLNETFSEDAELIAYLKRLVGYSATGVMGAHVMPFCYGSGRNGKSQFLEAIAGVLSMDDVSGYAVPANNSFLMARANREHQTEIASLAGRRFVICSEVNEHDRFDEAKVKTLTGDGQQRARYMNKDEFTFTATHHLWLAGNHHPEVRSGGPSFWRRIRLIPFLNTVPEHRQVDGLAGILVRECGPAILAWIVEGAAEYAASGLQEPDSVKAATAEYARDQDHLGRFLAERCHLGGAPLVKIRGSELFASYEAWCRSEGLREHYNSVHFGRRLKAEHGLANKTIGGRSHYLGITLLNDDEPGEG